MLMQVGAVAATIEPASQSSIDGVGHVLCLVGIMLTAGALGGVINYYQSVESPLGQSNETVAARFRPRMWHRTVVGIGAALLVPLFLNMISSDLLLACKESPSKLLVFAGFCIVASISSSAFIRSLSDRLLEQAAQSAEEANRRVDEVKTDLEPIKAKATEPGVETVPGSGKTFSAEVAPPSPAAQKVLRALCETEFAFRSLEGLSKSTGIGRDELETILSELSQEGFVRHTSTEDGLRWCITKKGRELEASSLLGQGAEVVSLRKGG
jgi:hypothetical protein